jgi:hypothetical protein
MSETLNQSIIQELIDAGLIDEGDVVASKNDDVLVADQDGQGSSLHGRDGDDVLVGSSAANRFFFDGRDDNNDEGRHVDFVRNFSFDDGDSLGFRLDGGFFKDAIGNKMDQSRNGNQAEFDSALDFADLMLHLNKRDGVVESLSQEEIDAGTGANGKTTNEFRNETKNDTTDGSYVRVVGEHIVMNFDDGKGNGETVDNFGNYKTNDITIVFENFEEHLSSTLANELGFGDEWESNQDSVHILNGDAVSGGDGDNLFIMSNAVDTVRLQRGSNNNDEGKHVNIIHGFDLGEDRLSLDSDFKGLFSDFAGGNGKFATFEGAPGIAQLMTISTVSSVDDSNGHLSFDIQLTGGDPLTVVLTNTTFEDVYNAAADTIWSELTASGVFEDGEVPDPYRRNDDIDAGFGGGKGDDLYFATAAADSFHMDSRHAAEDGTQGTNDGDAHGKVIVGFGADDQMTFRIDGKFFEGSDLPGRNDNQATIGFDDLDELASFLNRGDKDAGDLSQAYYDEDTNSSVFVIDDSPGNNGDELTIVLYDSGDLLMGA